MRIINKLSKVIGFAVLSAFFAGSVYAADATNNHLIAKQQELIDKLQLTDTQKKDVEVIVNDSHTKRMAIMNEYKDEQGPAKKVEMRDKLKALHTDTESKLSKVLTPDQMNTLEQFQDEMAAQVKANK